MVLAEIFDVVHDLFSPRRHLIAHMILTFMVHGGAFVIGVRVQKSDNDV